MSRSPEPMDLFLNLYPTVEALLALMNPHVLISISIAYRTNNVIIIVSSSISLIGKIAVGY